MEHKDYTVVEIISNLVSLTLFMVAFVIGFLIAIPIYLQVIPIGMIALNIRRLHKHSRSLIKLWSGEDEETET